jgi:hypothetical protein
MRRLHTILSVLGGCLVLSCGGVRTEHSGSVAKALTGGQGTGPFQNSTGLSANVSTAGSIDFNNEFFQNLGTNGRECVSCHSPEYGFAITPDAVQQLFNQCETNDNQGQNPNASNTDSCAIFRTVDGSNSPNADVSTKGARQAAYSVLLSKGLIRESFPFPPPGHPRPMFDIIAASDPYGYGTTSLVSVFRRPLPATNLPFESGVMWDLRESSTNFLRAPYDLTLPDGGVNTLTDQLKSQANDATLVHAQATTSLSDAVQQSIVNFETQLYSAQRLDSVAGPLNADGALGGPDNLSVQAVTPHCGNQFGLQTFAECSSFTFTTTVFTLFDAWANLQGTDPQSQKRASIARGQALFNTRATTSPVNPFFDQKNGTTCSACHSDFNTGATSVPIGFQNVTAGMGPNNFNTTTTPPTVSTTDFTSPDLPVYTLRCNPTGQAIFVATKGAAGCHDGSDGNPVDMVKTNDPGRGLITGSWGSVGAFKCPTLRNLSARAPYFHDGSAATLADVVDHYKAALGFQFTDDEKLDLVNFLSAL